MKIIEISSELEGPSDPIVLNALAQKLSTNTSINRLTISKS